MLEEKQKTSITRSSARVWLGYNGRVSRERTEKKIEANWVCGSHWPQKTTQVPDASISWLPTVVKGPVNGGGAAA